MPTTGTPLSGATLLGTPAYIDTSPTAGTTYYYVVTAVDISGNQSLASVAASAQASGSAANQAVQLNGSSQYVTFGAAPALNADDLHARVVVPAHRRGCRRHHRRRRHRERHPARDEGPLRVGSVDMNYFLGIDASTGTLVADFEDNATAANHPVTGTTPVTSNVWHHAAAAYDTATDTWRLYLDGALERTLVLAGDFTAGLREHVARGGRQRTDQHRRRRRLLPGRGRRGADLEHRPHRRADRRRRGIRSSAPAPA